MTSKVGVGIDVSKDKVDVALSDGTWSGVFEQTPEGLLQLGLELASRSIHRVVLEASGGYEREVLRVLHAHGLPVVLVEPGRARHFAKALGRLAKTDAIDAKVLARMALVGVDDAPLWEPLRDDVEELRGLVQRRLHLVVQRDAEKKRRRGASEFVLASIERIVTFVEAEIGVVEEAIHALLGRSEPLREAAATLEAVKGVGRVTSAALLVSVPELGRINRKAAAALVGVAPMNRDSGKRDGQRFVQGGRALARNALYMAALSASRHNPHIAEFYKRLRSRGKASKVALVACMRKLLIHLNAIMRPIIQERSAMLSAADAAA